MSINPVGAVSSTVPGVTAPYPEIPQAPGDLLASGPAVRTGALIGYARVSTSGQLLDRQQRGETAVNPSGRTASPHAAFP